MIFLYIVFLIGVILLIREIVMWYWKINILVQNQHDQRKTLESILDELKKLNNKL